MSALALQTGSQRQRRRKHSFRQLPGGTISGSSTNPETIGRNRRRQKLTPLNAELERIRGNKANRISNRIRKLKRRVDWQLLSKTEQEAAIQAIRDAQEARYRRDKKRVQEQYKTDVENREQDETSRPQPLPGSPSPNATTQGPTATPFNPGSESSSTQLNNFTISNGGSICGREIQEAKRGNREEEIAPGEVSQNDQERVDSLKALDTNSASLVKEGFPPQSSIHLLIAAIEQSHGAAS